MSTTILYHGNCFDGFTAAWVAKQRHPDAVLLPCIYGKDVPDFDPASNVFMIDVSYPRPVMDALLDIITKAGGTFTVLDHHATAERALEGFPGATFNLRKSGARLAWEYFFPLDAATPPPLVAYVEDRDLWRFELPYSREINAVIQATPMEIRNYTDVDEFVLHKRHDAVTLGSGILRSQDKLIDQMCREVRFYALGSFRVPVVNASVLFSEVANELLTRHPDSEIAGYYFNRGDGWQQWGLRSRPGVDCSALAQTFGGGGHPQASGFQFETDTVPFVRVP